MHKANLLTATRPHGVPGKSTFCPRVAGLAALLIHINGAEQEVVQKATPE